VAKGMPAGPGIPLGLPAAKSRMTVALGLFSGAMPRESQGSASPALEGVYTEMFPEKSLPTTPKGGLRESDRKQPGLDRRRIIT